jgi:PBP1b-binding outer membrane lipoprotein LpoB
MAHQLLVLIAVAALLGGCAVVDTAVSVAGTAVSTTASVAGTVIETTADVATSPFRSGEDEDPSAP